MLGYSSAHERRIMPTIIGLIFFLASIYFFFQKNDSLFALVIISSIFHASSVIATEEHGVEPYYLVAAVFVLQSMYRGRIFRRDSGSFKGRRWMLLFAVVAISSAMILPAVFAGIPVYDPYVGIDDGLFFRPPLHLGLANFTQSVYLLLDVLVVLGAAQNLVRAPSSRKAYMFTFYFLAGTVILQFICSVIGIAFPYALLQTHGGYNVQEVQAGDWSSRFPGTFTESSGAGLVLATFTAGFLAERLKFGKSLFPALIGLFSIFLVRATGSLAAIGLIVVLLLIAHPIWRFPFYINLLMLRRCALLIGMAALALVIVVLSPLRDSLTSATAGKQEGASFVNRTASDVYALELLIKTKGLGVGMGSNRPSSLLTSLLSTVGVIGFAAFLLAYFKLLANASQENAWLRWAGFALFLDIAFSDPDFTAPWIWVFLAFAVQAGRLQDLKTPILARP